jgi:hypothetical protein
MSPQPGQGTGVGSGAAGVAGVAGVAGAVGEAGIAAMGTPQVSQ